MRPTTHAADSRARAHSKRADESESDPRKHFDSQKSVTLMSQRDYEIGPRESRAKRSRGAMRDLSRAFAGAASRLPADSKKHEL